MDSVHAGFWLLGLVALASLIGAWWRYRDGRVRESDGQRVKLTDTELSDWGEHATLVQFSTEMCSRCPGTRRFLRQVAAEYEGVIATEIDLTHRADLASEYGILQTPTVFIVDGYGRVQATVAGVPKADSFRTTLSDIVRRPRDDYAI
ncbi:MAG TPA: thioredoxin domain-containing protein [Microbacteriaceae bacterium]|nr:thioredoxin domain-containing protein [Microbacteriaceae bacterium]